MFGVAATRANGAHCNPVRDCGSNVCSLLLAIAKSRAFAPGVLIWPLLTHPKFSKLNNSPHHAAKENFGAVWAFSRC